MNAIIRKSVISLTLLFVVLMAYAKNDTQITGKILSTETGVVDFATVYLKGTTYGSVTNEKGFFHLKAPAGDYTLVVSSVGYETTERAVQLVSGKVTEFNITITPVVVNLEEVVVASNGITNVKNSPFNTMSISTENLKNSTKHLSDALAKAPRVKWREAGGVGSDQQ